MQLRVVSNDVWLNANISGETLVDENVEQFDLFSVAVVTDASVNVLTYISNDGTNWTLDSTHNGVTTSLVIQYPTPCFAHFRVKLTPATSANVKVQVLSKN